ncbi:perilipin-1 isoform X2 [Hoplias malabaricus]|uniref:perilipin-1 isoform X2 n=1 Tax=Hoplias malabaricus TaxID=27720 RepID=UPI00346347E8
MVPAEKDQDKTEDKQNLFLRLRNLPSVSITFEVIGRSYSSAKAANPLLSSVCGVCEEGVRSAGILAARSMQPAVHLLQPQLVAANSLACRGLDRLEEKMPALDYPPAKLAAGISDLMSSAVRSPAVQYVLSSKISQLAEEGADSALTLTERLVNYILPASSEEKEEKVSEVCVAAPKPSFVRLGVLAGTVWSRAYGKTSALLQQIKRQGQKLTSQGVTPQVPDL